MRLKSFHGATLSEAMRLVREALGDNAIIVATRDDDNGGVRVTAAIDEAPARGPDLSSAAQAHQQGSSALETIADALTRHQVVPTIAEKLMATATQFASDDPLLALGAAFDTHLKFDNLPEDKPVMLVGPPGVGKTLCTAKYATKATLAKHMPTVISTDLERAGGMEQLAAFTRLLKLNMVEIEDCHALRDIIGIQKGGPVYIDTAGCNPFDAFDKQRMRDFIAAVGDATLVLPAGLDAADAVEVAQEFRALGASRLLVTRLDTVKRLGSLLRLAYDSHMPLAAYSASYKVTDAVLPLNAIALARLVLKIPGAAMEEKDAPKSAYGGVA
ncbi:MAG: GTPase [Alphaproteobacteria bacterium]|nr:GTPase [Alphaproteobacteria bacterium]